MDPRDKGKRKLVYPKKSSSSMSISTESSDKTEKLMQSSMNAFNSNQQTEKFISQQKLDNISTPTSPIYYNPSFHPSPTSYQNIRAPIRSIAPSYNPQIQKT